MRRAIQRVTSASVAFLKRLWMKFIVGIERTVYLDAFERLDRAYRIPDPWNQNSTKERARYACTNEFISRHCSSTRTILEIGAGEGYQTRFLLGIAEEVVGLEVSSRALGRATRQCPTATFIRTSFPPAPQGIRPLFDVVLAAEVLYYMSDVDAAVAAMNRCGRFCIASCYEREAERLDRHLLGQPDALHEDIVCEGMKFRLYYWQPRTSEPTAGFR